MHISSTKAILINHKLKYDKIKYRSRIETWKWDWIWGSGTQTLNLRSNSYLKRIIWKKKIRISNSYNCNKVWIKTFEDWGSRFTCELGSGPLSSSESGNFCERRRAGRSSYIRNACPSLPLGFPKRTAQSRVLAVEVDLSNTFWYKNVAFSRWSGEG